MALQRTVLEERALDVRTILTEAGGQAIFATASVRSPSDPLHAATAAYAPIARALRQRNLAIVHERVFGSLSAEDAVLAVRNRVLGDFAGPGRPTYVQGAPPWGHGLSGLLLHAAPIDRVHVLDSHGSLSLARKWSTGGPAQVVLQGLDGLDRSAGADNGREAQMRRVFERAFATLAAQGIGPTGLVRTWFYVDRMGESYAAFNRARDAAFSAKGLMSHAHEARCLPASTAIGCTNARGAAVILDLVAVDGAADGQLETLVSPVQPEALSYGGAFSRANRLRGKALDIVHLSGTAAIGPNGETRFPTDAESQIHATLEGVQRLLGAYGADLSGVVGATAFVKRAADAPLFERALRSLRVPLNAYVIVVADVCRDDLLFELDAELVLPTAVELR